MTVGQVDHFFFFFLIKVGQVDHEPLIVGECYLIT